MVSFLIIFLFLLNIIFSLLLGNEYIIYTLLVLMFLYIILLHCEISSIKNLFFSHNSFKRSKHKGTFYTSIGESISYLFTEDNLKRVRLSNALSDIKRLQAVQTSTKISDYICDKEKFYSLILDFALTYSSANVVSFCNIFNNDIELFIAGVNSNRLCSTIKSLIRSKFYGEGINDCLIGDERTLLPFGLKSVCFFRITWQDNSEIKNGILAFYYPVEKDISLGEEKVLNKIKEKVETNLTAKFIINNLGNRVEEVENINRHNSDAIKNVSHDLRSPINNIKAGLSLLENSKDKKEISELVQIAQRNCNILLSFVNDILDYAQFNSKNVVSTYQNIDFVKELTSLVDDFQILASSKNLELSIDIPSSLGNKIISVDIHHFRRIILNIVSNAIKYTKEGSVRISVYEDSKDEIIKITDTGIGMTSEQLKLLGIPFTRFQSDMAEGSGLGISLVKRLVNANNGEIYFSSQFGAGTEVKILFPKVKEVRVPKRKKEERKSKRVLIVDNDLDCVLSTRKVLEKSGYNVSSAIDVNEACKALSEKKQDFLITDLNMPNGGGEKIINFISENNLSTKVIVVSGIEKDEFQERFSHLNTASFFTKPLEFDLLFDVLN